MSEVLYDEIRELKKENNKLKEERNTLIAELQKTKERIDKSILLNRGI